MRKHALLLGSAAALFAVCTTALAVEAPADGWHQSGGLFQDPHNHNFWTVRATPSALVSGVGKVAGMTGSQALFLKGAAEAGGIACTTIINICHPHPGTESLDSFIRNGGLERRIPLQAWRGQRLRLTVRLKNDGAARAYASAQIVMGDAAPIRTFAQRNAAGASAWEAHQFVLDVPDRASDLAIDVGLTGKGTVWLDGITLEAVSKAVPVSRRSNKGAELGIGLLVTGSKPIFMTDYPLPPPVPGPEDPHSL